MSKSGDQQESSQAKQERERLLDFQYAAKISFCLLKPMGVWPLPDHPTALDFVILGVSIAFTVFFQLCMIVPWFISIIALNWSFYDFIRTACPLIFVITIFLRYILLMFHRDGIKSLIDHVAEDWRNVMVAEHREIMLANAKTGRFFGILSTSFMFGCGLPYCFMPLLLPPMVKEENVTIRMLPNPGELLVLDVQVTPVYEVVYFSHVLACSICYAIFCGICSLTAKLVMHACGQCEILMHFIEEMVDGNKRDQNTVDQRISMVVTSHLRILRFISDIDKVFNEICLAEFINSSSNICLLCYYVIIDLRNQESMLQILVYFFAFISLTFNIYIFCYIGEQLVNQCRKIGTTCYMIEWYRLPHSKARSMIFPIIMSNYPIELTAGRMVKLTMSSFSGILKISMTYFNLLREVSSRDVI